MSEPLSYALENKIAVVTMDDGKANALSEGMIAALTEALARAQEEARALVLLGRPDRFCGGFDMSVMMSTPEAARGLVLRGAALLMKLYASRVPLVVACTGHALAAGALLVLTGDVRIGTAGAYRIGLNEVQIGLPVPVLAMELARARLLPTELARATLGAHIYGPEDARAAGYLDEVVAAGALRARAIAEAARLGGLSPRAYHATKLRLRRATIEHIEATLEQDVLDLMSG